MLTDIACKDISFLIRIVANLVKYLHFLIPIILIVLVIFDIAKVVIGQTDDKAKTEMFNKIVKRVIYAVIIFLVPTILFFIFEKIEDFRPKNSKVDGSVSATTWYDCFKQIYNE